MLKARNTQGMNGQYNYSGVGRVHLLKARNTHGVNGQYMVAWGVATC